MKSKIIEPNKENIIEAITSNVLGRNENIVDLINLLDNIDGHYSIAIDSRWGNGKTFFVKQVEMILNYLLGKLSEDDNAKLDKCCIADKLFATLKPESKIIPIYYNSWLYDNHPEPALSILYAISHSEGFGDEFGKKDSSPKDKIFAIIDILNVWTNGSLREASEVIEGKDLFQNIKSLESINSALNELFDELLEQKNHKILLIIDELDRCKPLYAIEVLERMKHFFSDDRIIFLYSINAEQLTHTVKHVYGSAFDANNYLNRFFDASFSLPLYKETMENYALSIGVNNYGDIIDIVAQTTSDYFGFSIREYTSYWSIIYNIKKRLEKKSSKWYMIFVIYLIGVRINAAKDYNLLIDGKGFELLHKYIESSDVVKRIVTEMAGRVVHPYKGETAYIDVAKEVYYMVFDDNFPESTKNHTIENAFNDVSKKQIMKLLELTG